MLALDVVIVCESCDAVPPTAGKQVTEDDIEEMLESDNVTVFTEDVSNSLLAHQ